MEQTGHSSGEILTFLLGDCRFGILTSQILEVVGLHAGAVQQVPGAPSCLLGLINLRGKIVPLVNGSAVMGLPLPQQPAHTAFICRFEEQPVGFIVDELQEVLDWDSGEWGEPQNHPAQAFLAGLFGDETFSLPVLAPDKLFAAALDKKEG